MHQVDVCIVGGGPAGLLLGLLLAKQGLQTLVLEQHQDFSREYRGEVLMPRFARLFDQLNLLDYIRGFPHTPIDAIEVRTGRNEKGYRIPIASICREYPYALWMPQPVFLDALYRKAKSFRQFELWFGASATELIQEDGQTVGVRVRTLDKNIDVKARVTVGADGRTSRIRHLGDFQLEVDDYSFDVIWFSLPRPENFSNTVQGLFTATGRYIVAPKHPDLIQCGLITKPGQFAALRGEGLETLKAILREGPEVFQAFAESLQNFKPFHPLQARLARVRQWAQDGLLLIGDAAHTCSPMGAVGVSIALESAAVAADVLPQALRENDVSAQALGEVQQQRVHAVCDVQDLQMRLGNTFVASSTVPPWAFSWLIRAALRLNVVQAALRRLVFGEAVTVSSNLRFD
jgi:2-polyprenyl-6-methoxyphenol hydroxylase-like FAD-dependent oxidoreductase